VRPTTLMEKITIRVMSGARMRRITTKMAEDAWAADSICA
jgi:hypothetical protein